MIHKFDTTTSVGKRQNMVDEIENYFINKNFKDYNYILESFSKVPRHHFIPKGFEALSYEIKPVDIDNNQTMSTPTTVAIQTYLLGTNKGDKILEIGSGSGYQSAILSYLCREVHTIERHKILHQKAKRNLKELDIENVYLYYKDGFEGIPEEEPFDKIIVTCGAPEIPKNLLSQLKINGRMIIPTNINNNEEGQLMKLLIKKSDTEYDILDYGKFNFVPMLNGINNI